MQEKQNVFVRQSVRRDMFGRALEFFVPADMPDDVLKEVLDERLKSGAVSKVVRVPVVDRGGAGADGGAGAGGGAGVAAAEEMVFGSAPASVQIFGAVGLGGVRSRFVSGSVIGPCLVNRVAFFTTDLATGLNAAEELSAHVSQSRDVPPFAGDIELFRMYDPSDLYGIANQSQVHIYKQRNETLVGWRDWQVWEFFPHVTISFPRFYVSFSIAATNLAVNAYCTVDFAPIQIPKSSVGGRVSVEPRQPVASKPKAVAVGGLTTQEMRFTSYAEMKTFEALGNRIVWSSLAIQRGFPQFYTATVTVKG